MTLRLRLAVVLCCLSLVAAALPAGEPLPSLAGKRVLVLGDSITQAGDWVTFVAYRLAKAEGRLPDLISIGLASETASGLSEQDHPFPRPCVHERLGRALGLVKPQVVMACYGMNDGIYQPLTDQRMAAFQQGIRTLISAGKAAGAAVVLLTPPPFDPQPVRAKLGPADAPDLGYKRPYEGYAGVLEAFARWQLSLPADQAVVVDFNGPITAYIAGRRRSEPAFALSGDGIHPSKLGLLLMADPLLVALGQPSLAGRLDAALAEIEADPLYPLVKKWRETRSRAWLDFVGYTREKTVKTESAAAGEEAAAALAKQIAERLAK